MNLIKPLKNNWDQNNRYNPVIMGILNATPDSFFDGGAIDGQGGLIHRIEQMIMEGADIIDVGAESTRPGAAPVSFEEEIQRLQPVLNYVKNSSVSFSIDTYKPEVAQIALDHGFSMINDITGGGKDGKMLALAADYKVPIVIMHMLGEPRTMQSDPSYSNVMASLISFFKDRIELAKSLGVKDEQIILDPGIGFGKRIQDNDRIIRELEVLSILDFPILLGASRKSFLSIDEDGPADRLAASISILTLAVERGVQMLRVHDVMQSKKCAKLLARIFNK